MNKTLDLSNQRELDLLRNLYDKMEQLASDGVYQVCCDELDLLADFYYERSRAAETKPQRLFYVAVGPSHNPFCTTFAMGEEARDRAIDRLSEQYPEDTITATEIEDVHQ